MLSEWKKEFEDFGILVLILVIMEYALGDSLDIPERIEYITS